MYNVGRLARAFELGLLFLVFFLYVEVYADATTQAATLYKRLTGVNAPAATVTQMASLISQGRTEEAAALATQSPYFYEITVRNWAAPLSNLDQLVNVPLNDSIALVIGMTRDDLPFDQVLYENLLYTGTVAQAYTPATNAATTHFAQVDAAAGFLSTKLNKVTQSQFSTVPDIAGIQTTQAWANAAFNAGTNRRGLQKLVNSFWCREMEQIKDTSVPSNYIRKDVDRAPSGDPATFQNKCLGCHSWMDPLAAAFSYFNYDATNGLQQTPGVVQTKVTRNADVYPQGHQTTNDQWRWMGRYSASNSFGEYGFPEGSVEGAGAKALGIAFSQSAGFGQCVTKRIFRKVCLYDATDREKGLINSLATQFAADGHNLKKHFHRVAIRCMGE